MAKLTDEEILQALDASERYPTRKEAAESLGLHVNTLAHRVNLAKQMKPKANKSGSKIQAPSMPADDVDTKVLIKNMVERYKTRAKHHEAKKWMPFKVNENLPIGINWFGDPHLDDNGCNWDLLARDCEIVAKTAGMYGANIGDTHNNWVGRLTRLYADQDTSKDTSYKLVEWFFKDSEINWLIMLLGNHDTFTDDGARYLRKLCENICPMEEWRAQFKLVFPNGREVLVDAAHDHKGHSMWNGLHGQQKAAVMGGRAHLYIAGHRHFWALAQNECQESQRVYWLARAKGYKNMDQYAINNGYGEQHNGSSIVTVINPLAKNESGLIKCFADVQEGADYLTFLRKQY